VVVGSGGARLYPDWAESNPGRYESGRNLFVAKMRLEHKGLHLLLEGFSLARKQMPHLTLDLVLPVDLDLRQLEGVTRHSDLTRDALTRLYAKTALFTMPALHEPWGLVYLEAVSAGAPFLCLNRMGVTDIASTTGAGILVDRAEASAIAEALVRAHTNPARLADMGRHGKDAAVHFSWERTVERTLSAAMSAR